MPDDTFVDYIPEGQDPGAIGESGFQDFVPAPQPKPQDVTEKAEEQPQPEPEPQPQPEPQVQEAPVLGPDGPVVPPLEEEVQQ